ncbi:MAG: PQQ-binding-like beta-propeller repeat protein [Alphaproteobacteria bacterium]|nr:PQQ-binding-like beta-propeller repeat protein [Alphaproteobacteria bacterium]
MKQWVAAGFLGAASLLGIAAASGAGPDVNWLYNGGFNNDHYAPLSQITPANVASLKEAWRYPMPAGGLQAQPMMIGRTLYVVTTQRALAALDAATGAQKWLFDPKLPGLQPIRGLTSWSDNGKLRIVFGNQNFLYLIDAETGQPVPTFGDNGRIDARANLRGPAENNAIYLTSPISVYKDLLIVNGREAENSPASPGDVRAFDAHTGKLVWTFHTIPHPGEEGVETWPANAYMTQGAANAWSGSSVDTARGIVFVNTGSAADDFYGGNRPGNLRFANSTIALDANTGKRIWDFQQVHHDIWDSDSTSPPILMTITRNGRRQDVTVATNKQSFIYVFDRTTGRPVYPIEEKPFPKSNVPGEVTSPTQPIPTLPKPLSRRSFTEADLTTTSPEANAEARAAFAQMCKGEFQPICLNQDTLVTPGFGGGNEWGGMAADHNGVIYAAVQNTSSMTRLEPNPRLVPGYQDRFPADQNGYPTTQYSFTGYGGWRLKGGAQPFSQPIATLNAVDLNTGQYRWTIPFNLASNGGPAVTESGLLFIGASGSLQAFDTRDGKLLFESKLPATAGLTPAVYMVDGKEYVALASAGRGDSAYVAYALPN